ncbi:MAG: peptide chain release factor N(5)-glutamine methyltransferase [Mariniphaga sp.]|nr:peptide chain release factor N(5)-glutamine methyltransferase [Mariniphaga sp.]
MFNKDYYLEMKSGLKSKIRFPEDKPEENLDSTLKALWYSAIGKPISAQEAARLPIPDLSEKQFQILNELLKLRMNNTPLAHITGRQNFMGIELKSDNRALIPRKETEILGTKALEFANILSCTRSKVNIIDVCCGSGNLGIALAHYNPQVHVFASDLLEEATELANENISLLNLKNQVNTFAGDMFEPYESNNFYGEMDLVVCNPPYISTSKAKHLSKEVHVNEPVHAFDGGMLGLKIIQKLIKESPKFLVPKGWLLFEVGAGQSEFIIKLCKSTKLYDIVKTHPDENGYPRVIYARKK